MSSIFTRTTKASSKGDVNKARVRSRSAAPADRSRNAGREAKINFNTVNDVASQIGIEIAGATLRNPDMITGLFFETASDSRRDLHKSDAVIIISAAVLDHIGNTKMAREMLGKSKTCAGYYKQLGLEVALVRRMFVTLLFALNPAVVTILERCMIVAFKRSTELGPDVYSNNQIADCITTLHREGSIANDEISTIVDDSLASRLGTRGRRLSIATTPPGMIGPSDSVSNIIEIPPHRRGISAADMQEYILRRKRGKEPEFSEVFKHSKPPVSVNIKNNRNGLGYVKSEKPVMVPADEINEILGTQRRLSFDLETGRATYREPRVEDFIDSEEIASTVVRQTPETDPESWDFVKAKPIRRPSPTELFLPDSVVVEKSRPPRSNYKFHGLQSNTNEIPRTFRTRPPILPPDNWVFQEHKQTTMRDSDALQFMVPPSEIVQSPELKPKTSSELLFESLGLK
jgi:hypothetical protein